MRSPLLPVPLLACALGVFFVGGGCPKDPPKPYAPPRDYSLYLTRYPFGGQTLEWWQERINDLAPGGKRANPALFELTVARARKNGLVVTDGVVKVGPELTARIIARLEEDEAKEKTAPTTETK